tara:strand:+ start:313 stop:462 length:150 start_codon:yes stop_codon:yes gene_type:complete
MGEALEYTNDEYKSHYAFFNQLTPGTEGVSSNDLLVANKIYKEVASQDP